MLILDQFEELLATASPQTRQEFLVQLRDLLSSDLPLTLMVVMRDDFFSRLAHDAPSALFEWVQRGFMHISAALEESELQEIIEGPAKKVGLQFEEGLIGAIVKDVLETSAAGERAGRSTVLPLLEFALTELWSRRKEGYLIHEAYAAIGGVTGSLTQWADQAYQSLAKDGLGAVTRRVLTELVNLGDERQGMPDSRRRRTLDDFCTDPVEKEAVYRVVRKLADARLATTSFDRKANQETVELIHDSLIREWARLRQWLKEDRGFLSWDREMEKRAQSWEETSPEVPKRDEGKLLRGLDLSEAEGWLEKRGKDLGRSEEQFIRASLALRENERLEKERRRRAIIMGLAAFSAVALILAGAALWEWNLSEQKTDEALALYLASQSEQIKATSGSDYARKVLLAVESLRHKETAVGDLALRRSMALMAPPLAQLEHNSPVMAMAFSPDGTKVLTGSFDRMARIWDVSTGQVVHKLAHDGEVYAVAFSTDGTKALTGGNDSMARIWNASTGQKICELPHEGAVYAVAFSPDGTMALTGSNDSWARIWNVSTGQEFIGLGHYDGVYSVAFSHDGTKALTGSDDRYARIWDIPSRTDIPVIHIEDPYLDGADGLNASANSNDSMALIRDISIGQAVTWLAHDDRVDAVAFSHDGTKVLTYSGDITRVWDISTGQEVSKLVHGSLAISAAFSPDGMKVLTGSLDGKANIWEVSTGQVVQELPHDGLVLAVAFSPDGTKALTGSLDRYARIWDISTGQVVQELPHDGGVYAVAFGPDGTQALTGSNDSMARIWNASTGQVVQELPHRGWVFAVAFSPDGTKALTGSSDSKAYIWDVSTGRMDRDLAHDGAVRAVAFSPDGMKVLTGSYDRMTRIWDVLTGQEVHKLSYNGEVTAVAFSPDGTKFASSSEDKTAWIWPVSADDLINEACGSLAGNLTAEEWRRCLEESDPNLPD